jgi:hypothetical protein
MSDTNSNEAERAVRDIELAIRGEKPRAFSTLKPKQEEKPFIELKMEIADKAKKLMMVRSDQYAHEGEDHIHAKIMLLLFPNGIPGTFTAFARYKELSFIVEKLCRYTAHFNENDDEDSVIDIINFATMLAAFDARERAKK